MTTIMPQGELLRRAVKWIDGQRELTGEPVPALINKAAMKEAEEKNATPTLLPMVRFHDMRHTAATLLLLQGVHPKVVSERLGHASIEITLNTNSHELPTMGKEAAAKLDKLFG